MSRPVIQLWIGDYLRDTRGLSALEHGAYLLLIFDYWTNGGLPDDDAQLARIACCTTRQWRRVKPVINRFFYSGWKHHRLEVDLRRQKETLKRFAERASRAGKARWNKDRTMLKASAKHSSSNASDMLGDAYPKQESNITSSLTEPREDIHSQDGKLTVSDELAKQVADRMKRGYR